MYLRTRRNSSRAILLMSTTHTDMQLLVKGRLPMTKPFISPKQGHWAQRTTSGCDTKRTLRPPGSGGTAEVLLLNISYDGHRPHRRTAGDSPCSHSRGPELGRLRAYRLGVPRGLASVLQLTRAATESHAPQRKCEHRRLPGKEKSRPTAAVLEHLLQEQLPT